MDKRHLLELIRKWNRNEATPEEEQLLKNYYDFSGNEPGGLSDLPVQDKALLKKEIFQKTTEQLAVAEKLPYASGGKAYRVGLRIAAAACLAGLFVTMWMFFYPKTGPVKSRPSAGSHTQQNQLVYLPDGSKVIVSAGSRLYCNPAFGTSTREVYLSGQAYFDISHDASRPFVVHTGKLSTTVLGTAFNIKALPGEKEITVTVTRGRVKISDEKKVLGLVTPGRQIIYDQKSDGAVQQTVDSNARFDWKEQDLLVNDVTVEEAAQLLEDRFGVTITVHDSAIRRERFTTVFLKGEGLEQILRSVCEFNDAGYQYNHSAGTVAIRRRGSPPED